MTEESYKQLASRLQRELDFKSDQIARMRSALTLPVSSPQPTEDRQILHACNELLLMEGISVSAIFEIPQLLKSTLLVRNSLQDEVDTLRRKLSVAKDRLAEMELFGVRVRDGTDAPPKVEGLVKEVQDLRVRCITYETELDRNRAELDQLRSDKQKISSNKIELEAALDEKEELLIKAVRDMEEIHVEMKSARSKDRLEIEQLKTEVEFAESQLSMSQARTGEIEKEMKKLKLELKHADRRSELESLSEQIAANVATIQQLQDQLASRAVEEDEVRRLQAQTRSLREELDSVEKLSQDQQSEIGTILAKLRAKAAHVAQLEAQLESTLKEVIAKNSEISKSQEQLASARRSGGELETALISRNEEILVLRAEIREKDENAAARLSNLRKELDVKTGVVGRLEEELRQEAEVRRQLKAQIDRQTMASDAQAKAAETQLADIGRIRDQMNSSLEVAIEDEQQLHLEMEGLKEELAGMRSRWAAERTQLSSDLATTKTQLIACQDDLAISEFHRRTLEAELCAVQENHQSVSGRLERSEVEARRLARSLDEVEAQLESIQEHHRAELARFQVEVTQVHSELHVQQQAVEAARKDVRVLEDELNRQKKLQREAEAELGNRVKACHLRENELLSRQQAHEAEVRHQHQAFDAKVHRQKEAFELEVRLHQEARDAFESKVQQQQRAYDAKANQEQIAFDTKVRQQQEAYDAKVNQEQIAFDAKVRQQQEIVEAHNSKVHQQQITLDSKVKELQSQEEFLHATSRQLEQQRDALKEQQAAVERRELELKSHQDGRTSQLTELRASYESSQRELHLLQGAEHSRQFQISILEEKISLLEARVREMSGEFQKELANEEELIRELRDRVSDLESEIAQQEERAKSLTLVHEQQVQSLTLSHEQQVQSLTLSQHVLESEISQQEIAIACCEQKVQSLTTSADARRRTYEESSMRQEDFAARILARIATEAEMRRKIQTDARELCARTELLWDRFSKGGSKLFFP